MAEAGLSDGENRLAHVRGLATKIGKPGIVQQGQCELRDQLGARDLNGDLLQLQRRDPDGSHAARPDGSYALARMPDALHEAGYRGLRAKGFKGKHIEALVRDWRAGRVSDATVMNRMAHVHWWAERGGGAGNEATSPTVGNVATWTRESWRS